MSINCRLLAAFLVIVALAARPAPSQDSPGNGLTPMAPASGGSSDWKSRFTGPGMPAQPGAGSRPSTWPGQNPSDASPNGKLGLPPGELHQYEGAEQLGGVGQDVIIASDVMPPINAWCEKNKYSLPPGQLEEQRMMMIREGLQTRITTLLIVQDAKRTIPTEGWSHVQDQLTKEFEEKELEKMMKQSGAGSRHELDQQLRAMGTSLEKAKKGFCERELGRSWLGEQIKRNDEITYEQMVTYYRKHQNEFTKPARARWEELVVSYARYPTKAAAYDAIARLGNQVLAGAPLGDIAKANSDGVTASNGGGRDWTTPGSLVCKELDRMLFRLPIGELSPIIEGPTGYHIVRVTKRDDAVTTPFLDAQADIQKKIFQQRRETHFKEYLTKLKARTPVWTIFDATASKGEQQTAERLSQGWQR
ncbi:MAG: peptidyl-prolyl cis-trans isomerase [Thermoguttaceae bacterium]